jgi:hypothetical protein
MTGDETADKIGLSLGTGQIGFGDAISPLDYSLVLACRSQYAIRERW